MTPTDPEPIDVRHLDREQVIACYRMGDALIDPGPAVSLPNLLEALGDWRPSKLLLTHIHLDHAGGTGTLVERWPDVEVWVHERGAKHMIDPSRLLASATRLYGDDMDRLWGEMLPIPEANVRVLTGGEHIDGWEVAYTPGHASHHVAYRHEATNWVFTGDVAGVRIAPSAYILAPTPPPDIDIEAWQASVSTLEAWKPRGLAPTHFGLVTDPAEHLARLHVVLETWSELARRLDEESFLLAARAATASALPLADRDALDQSMPPTHLWPGLDRYWSKREA
ncbi:MAG: MBL fold metallo-hydrolase [Solirubrobacteraceae bacterium]|nr:MBL fold metallo-hydrolase [Solirubrobacteraceae bacterium]